MRKYTLTTWVLVVFAAAFLASFGTNLVSAMNDFMVTRGWCGQVESWCLLWHDLVFLSAIIIIVIIIDYVRIHWFEWNKVKFYTWTPTMIDRDVLGGIKIHNGKDDVLEECIAELMGWEDDVFTRKVLPSMSDIMQDSILPCKLYWFEDNDFKESVSIGRDKDGYIAIFFPEDEDGVKVVNAKDFQYRIHSIGRHGFGNMIHNGYYEVRISAKSLKPIIKRVRIETNEKALFIKEVLDAPQEKNGKPKIQPIIKKNGS
jgi:hypothetical protein